MLRRIHVGDNERVFVIRNGRFETILDPGSHVILGTGVQIERHNIRELVLVSDWKDLIVKQRPELAGKYFVVVNTGDTEIGLISFDGNLTRVVAPGSRVLYWKGPYEISAVIINARTAPEVPAWALPAVARLGRESFATFALVEEGKRGLLFLDGKLIRELGPGNYGVWNAAGSPQFAIFELRLQTLEASGQEILTRDKVTVRVSIAATFQIEDAVKVRSRVKDANEHLYRTVQIAVRQSLGKRTLEEVLADKVDIDESVSLEVRREMEGVGVRVGHIALKDIILPGDIRDILNQVVTAEKQAQANLIRRREETAATRSLLNTAKLMEDNPLLVRLKELETVERVAEKVEKITVVNGLEGLLSGKF